MKRTSYSLALLAALAACGDGEPLFDDDVVEVVEVDDDTTDDDTDGDAEITDPAQILNAGTVAPLAGSGELQELRGDIIRVEAENDNGGGVASSFAFNAADDTFLVDGLAFDGENIFQRSENVPTLGTASVFAGDATVPDFLTGEDVGQIVPYLALFEASDVRVDEDGNVTTDPDAEFRASYAIVRSGGFSGFGFGSFVYQRAGDVVIPTEGQATFSGDYAGLRVIDTFPEILLTDGDLTIAIDFEDFNTNPGIIGNLTNRNAFTESGGVVNVFNGNDAGEADADALVLPDVNFVLRQGGTSISDDGEIGGEVSNTIIDRDGNIIENYESGEFLGIIAGNTTDISDGGEIVGVLVFESPDIRFEGVTSQETGGFIATR